MPIRIKEIVVRTNIGTGNNESNNDSSKGLKETDLYAIRDWIVEECMEEVKELLNKKKLR
ncbi:MAG: DUF5908 family protein [Saprospiraceae bacterium]